MDCAGCRDKVTENNSVTYEDGNSKPVVFHKEKKRPGGSSTGANKNCYIMWVNSRNKV